MSRAPVRRVGMMHAVLLYDSDCGFCRWLVDKVLVWDRRGRVKSMELQEATADSLLGEIDADAKMSSWHLVTPDGRVHSAGAAAPPLLRLLPGGKPLAALLAAFPEGTERAYRTVARNRDRLGVSSARRRAKLIHASVTAPDLSHFQASSGMKPIARTGR